MTMKQVAEDLTLSNLQDSWKDIVANQLTSGENALTALEVDLDDRLNFKKGMIIATESRILSLAPGQTEWKSWDYRSGLVLSHHDHAGIGHLESVSYTHLTLPTIYSV